MGVAQFSKIHTRVVCAGVCGSLRVLRKICCAVSKELQSRLTGARQRESRIAHGVESIAL
jgi:hypothetical protein